MRNPLPAASTTWIVAAAMIAAALAGPAPAANRKADRDALADARPAGKPVDCVPLTQIRETRVRNDQVIDFYMRGGQIYRNTLPYGCPELGFEEAFGYKTSLSQLCSVDIITVVRHSSPGSPGASCGLGVFQPVTGVRR